ncbi:MAG: DUF1664 domain-containing protein [Candidatus Accumulibacter sp.]|jgi:hypothetical protein|nr:DUF1664 domain-containing protein [Accumulibacter sp.]
MFIQFDPGLSRKAKNPFVKILAFVVGGVVLVAALLFSFVFFAVVAVIGAVGWLYFWWKTRALREEIRRGAIDTPTWEDAARRPERHDAGGRVIDGEAVEVPDDLPGD